MRMIDADVLIKRLKRNSIFEKITDCRGMNTIEIIEEQPTAYDVEKVVAELKELGNAEADYYYANSNDVIERETAIEIVENGGK